MIFRYNTTTCAYFIPSNFTFKKAIQLAQWLLVGNFVAAQIYCFSLMNIDFAILFMKCIFFRLIWLWLILIDDVIMLRNWNSFCTCRRLHDFLLLYKSYNSKHRELEKNQELKYSKRRFIYMERRSRWQILYNVACSRFHVSLIKIQN